MAYVWQKITRVKDTFYIVLARCCDGHTRISRGKNDLHYLIEVHILIKPGDIDSRSHYFRCCGIAEFQDALKHLFVVAGCTMRNFEGPRKARWH